MTTEYSVKKLEIFHHAADALFLSNIASPTATHPVLQIFLHLRWFYSPMLTTKVFEIFFWKLPSWDNSMIPTLSISKE